MNLFFVCRLLIVLLDTINVMVFHKVQQKQLKYLEIIILVIFSAFVFII